MEFSGKVCLKDFKYISPGKGQYHQSVNDFKCIHAWSYVTCLIDFKFNHPWKKGSITASCMEPKGSLEYKWF